MKDIATHINKDVEELNGTECSAQRKRHLTSELNDLLLWQEGHPNDSHDPSHLEMFCDQNPSEPECLIYED